MNFQEDSLIDELSKNHRRETFGLIICAFFHQPKPIPFVDLYRQLIDQLENSFNSDERQCCYLYPISYLHITISTLYSFKHPPPASPEKFFDQAKEFFARFKQNSRQQSIHLTIDAIDLSEAAGYFHFKDEANRFASIRQSIKQLWQPDEAKEKLNLPNIVHSTFLRFTRKLNDPQTFQEKFQRISQQIFQQSKEIFLDIDEICLAFESHPYMHIPCDESTILDVMKC